MKLTIVLFLFAVIVYASAAGGRARQSRRRNPLHLRSDQVQLTHIGEGTPLYKVSGLPNLEPQRAKFTNFNDKQDWSGSYASPDKQVATGYGSDYFDPNTHKSTYHMHNLKVGDGFHAVEIKNPNFASPNYPQAEKANQVKYFLRDKGLGQYEHQADKSHISHKDFNKLSENIQKTFATKSIRLTDGLDRNGIAYVGPHDEEGGREMINRRNTLRNLFRPKNSERVIESV